MLFSFIMLFSSNDCIHALRTASPSGNTPASATFRLVIPSFYPFVTPASIKIISPYNSLEKAFNASHMVMGRHRPMGAHCPWLLYHMDEKFINKCALNPTLMLSDYLLWSHSHLKLNSITDNGKGKFENDDKNNSANKKDICKVNLTNEQIESIQNKTDDVNTIVESIETTFKSVNTTINGVVTPN